MINRVILIGHLAADPEVKATPSGTFVATLRLECHSTNRSRPWCPCRKRV